MQILSLLWRIKAKELMVAGMDALSDAVFAEIVVRAV
jgi:hypothetical protein